MAMRTTILAYVIAVLGFVMIVGGVVPVQLIKTLFRFPPYGLVLFPPPKFHAHFLAFG
jgi:hypothetical protein